MIQWDSLPAACRAAREGLDGVIDGVAPDDSASEVTSHLVSCAACRATAGEVRAVVARLKQAPAAAAPADLSARLAAIAGHDACEPLWLAPSGDGMLPSPRQRRKRGLATGSVAVLTCMGLLFALGLMLAPPLAEVADAGTTANREFDLSLGIGAGAQAVNAVMASAQGGRLSHTDSIDRPQVMTAMDWRGIGQEQALALVLSSVDPRVGYIGVQRVTLAGAAGYVTANVKVAQQLGTALSVGVFDTSGSAINSGVLPARQSDVINTLPPSAASFRIARGGSIAGHPAVLLEAKRADRSLVARWWLSPELGLVLWNETFDSSGELVRSAGFTSLQLTSNSPHGANPLPLQLSKAPAVVAAATTAMCTGGFSCASALAGFELASISSDSPHNPGVIHALYEKDGVCVTVLQQRGRLVGGPGSGNDTVKDYGVSADRSVITWQSAGVVYTVTTNAGFSVAQQVADDLPHEAPESVHPLKRALAGLGRIIGRGPR